MMTPDELKRFRERRGLERGDLAELLNQALGRRYSTDTISRWERGDRQLPKSVESLLESLALGGISEGLSGPQDAATGPYGPDDAPLEHGAGPADSAPGSGIPDPQPQLVLLSGGGLYAKACGDMFEMIATGLGMVGAAIGSEALMGDGAIIAADKDALGAAWGRLAETNETFKRLLVSATEGGVWLQVALATGTTFSKCWQHHAAVAAHRAQTLNGQIPDGGAAAAEPAAA